MFGNPFRRKPQVLAAKKAPPPPPSRLVLAKLGHDLGKTYDTAQEPLPETIQRAVERLPDVSSLKLVQGSVPADQKDVVVEQQEQALFQFDLDKPIV